MIAKRKAEIMSGQSKKIDWKTVEDTMITQWYIVSKIIHTIIPPDFPYFTFKGIVEEIKKDPNYKAK